MNLRSPIKYAHRHTRKIEIAIENVMESIYIAIKMMCHLTMFVNLTGNSCLFSNMYFLIGHSALQLLLSVACGSEEAESLRDLNSSLANFSHMKNSN